MPTPLYRASVDFLNVIVTPHPDPSITFPLVGQPALTAGMALIVGDAVGNEWAAQGVLSVQDNGSGTAEFQAGYFLVSRATRPPFFVDTDDPLTFGVFAGTSVIETPGHDGSGLLAGGTLAIEKDFDNNRITLITPLGNQFEALDANDAGRAHSGLNNTPLFPKGIAFQYAPADTPATATVQFDYQNLDQFTNGVATAAIPMTALSPGTWINVFEYPFDITLFSLAYPFDPATGFGFGPGRLPLSSTQFTSFYQIRADLTVPDYPSFNSMDVWRRETVLSPPASDTDMDTAREHGVVWRASPAVQDSTVMLVQRTFDNAGTWETWTAFSDPTTLNTSPSITWYNQRLWLDWHNGTDMVQAVSLDGGRHWNMPTTIPFTGTNPRRVVDRTGGGSFLFFFDASNHLKLVITYDTGATYEGPFTVASSVIPQQIDAEFVPDGSLVASIFVAGVWTQYRSRDLGHSWS